MIPSCHYCGNLAELVGGDVIYPHRPDLAHKYFYRCVPCEAYVGCHAHTTKPLGILAKPDLRQLKRRVHEAFDPMWRSGNMRRSQAYRWLAKGLGIDPKQCHVGMFTEERCRAALEFLRTQNARENA